MEEPGKHLLPSSPSEVALEMRLEAYEEGKKVSGRKNDMSGGSEASRGWSATGDRKR